MKKVVLAVTLLLLIIIGGLWLYMHRSDFFRKLREYPVIEAKTDYPEYTLKVDKKLIREFLSRKKIDLVLKDKGFIDLTSLRFVVPDKIIINLSNEPQPFEKLILDEKGIKTEMRSFGNTYDADNKIYTLNVYIDEGFLTKREDQYDNQKVINTYILQGLFFVSANDLHKLELFDGSVTDKYHEIAIEIENSDINIFTVSKKSTIERVLEKISLLLSIPEVKAQWSCYTRSESECRRTQSITYCNMWGSCSGRSCGDLCYPYGSGTCVCPTFCETYAYAGCNESAGCVAYSCPMTDCASIGDTQCDMVCNPTRPANTCGTDNCGYSYDNCSSGYHCSAGNCVADCTPNCSGKVCGDNGCGGSCGTCTLPAVCNASGQCVTPTPTPTPTSTPTPTLTPTPTPSLTCTLLDSPAPEPYTVNLTGYAWGTATGDIRYRFDCENDGIYEYDIVQSTSPKKIDSACTYPGVGVYPARLRLDRQGIVATCGTNVVISAPPTPTTYTCAVLGESCDMESCCPGLCEDWSMGYCSCQSCPMPPTSTPVPPTSTPTLTPTSTPTIPPCPTPGVPAGLNPSSNLPCISTSTQSVNFSWNSVAGPVCSPVTRYAVRIDRSPIGVTDTWSGNCSLLNPGDYCNDNVSATSLSRVLDGNYNYRFWVHAINGIGWGLPAYGNFELPLCPTLTPTPVPLTPTPTPVCPVPVAPIGLAPSSDFACNNNATTTINFSWNPVAGPACAPVTSYAIRIDRSPIGQWNTWDGSCSAPDYCNDNVVGTSFSRVLDTNYNYRFWVHAINSQGWGLPTYEDFALPRCCSAVTADISSAPASPFMCQNYTVSWTSTGAGSCTVSGAYSGSGISGSTVQNKSTAGTYTYNLGCSNWCGNSASDSVSVTIPALTADVSVLPASPSQCQNYNVNWVSTGATSCTLSENLTNIPIVGTSGTLVRNKEVTGSYNYILSCTNACAVPRTDSVNVNIGPITCTTDVGPLSGVKVGTANLITASVSSPPGTHVDEVLFQVPPAGFSIAKVCNSGSYPPPGTLCPALATETYTDISGPAFTANVSIVNSNSLSAPLRARGRMTNDCPTIDIDCTMDESTITLDYELAWFQAMGGTVVTKGNVTSPIPSTATNLSFIKDPVALLIYSFTGSLGLGSGDISSTAMSSKASISYHPEATFDLFFNKRLPGAVKTGMTTLTSNSLAISSLNSCNLVRGYKICYYDGAYVSMGLPLGNLTLTGNYTIADDVRIILFVDNADVTIQGKINSGTRGRSSFLLISERNILIDPAVGGAPDSQPDLEGVFYTNGQFSSGHNASALDSQLHVRGSVAAGSFSLGRDLGSATSGNVNDFYPGEVFEYGTEQVMAFPPFLRFRPTLWSEVTP